MTITIELPDEAAGQLAEGTGEALAAQMLTLGAKLQEIDPSLFRRIVHQLAGHLTISPDALTSFAEGHPIWDSYEHFIEEGRRSDPEAVGS
jgi:hypothetical protein